MVRTIRIGKRYRSDNHLTLWHGDCLRFLRTLPDGVAQLVITSPPYNVGKRYECRQSLDEYVEFQSEVIKECVRITRQGGSICWQVGNHVGDEGELVPLDLLLYGVFSEYEELKLRNRIIWYFEHGLHCTRRFSGRHECVMWYSKGDDYRFNLDAVRVPQKYPGKRAYRGPNRGKPSGNPKGKNPGDVWAMPNVKSNHVEKTEHPCQFPIALAETLVLALTNPRHLVVDPFLGVGTTAVAAIKRGRRAAGADILKEFLDVARDRVELLLDGNLPYRPRLKPVYKPPPNTSLTTPPNGFARVPK